MEERKLTPGITGTASTVVTEQNVAAAVGSGDLQVFSTPYLLALMEEAAASAVRPYLFDGESTVGTMANLVHTAATVIGKTVTATATLNEIDRRRLTFTVTASDEAGEIGRCTHERFIIQKERFLKKAGER